MAWYKKYLSVYNKPFISSNQTEIQFITNKLKKLQSKNPLVTVSVIAYNEEKNLLACLWSLSEM